MGEYDDGFIQAVKNAKAEERFGIPGTTVDIKDNFYLSRYEITYEQFDYYVWEQQRHSTEATEEVKYPTTAKGGR